MYHDRCIVMEFIEARMLSLKFTLERPLWRTLVHPAAFTIAGLAFLRPQCLRDLLSHDKRYQSALTLDVVPLLILVVILPNIPFLPQSRSACKDGPESDL